MVAALSRQGSLPSSAPRVGRAVDADDARAFARERGIAVFEETSAKSGENVEAFFAALSTELRDRHRRGEGLGAAKGGGGLKITQPLGAPKKSKCGCA